MGIRTVAVAFVALLAACGGNKTNNNVCDQQPPPAACGMMCDPSPIAGNTCPAGFHCGANGSCTAECAPGGPTCPSGQVCSSDGHCVNGNGGPDASCPAVHFTAMPSTPYVELLLDRSGSMTGTDISPTRYGALHTALTGSMGAVTATQGQVYFGAALFSGNETPCPPNANFDGYSVPRALNNASAIDTLITGAGTPAGSTPTADWVTACKNDFATNPPPAGGAPIILLATDGDPNACGQGNDNGAAVAAVKAAYMAGIRTFVVGLQPSGGTALNPQFLQDVANAGVGQPTNQNPNCAGCAKFYTASDPTSLATGLTAIINGVLSCDLTLSGTVDPASANQGTVTLNGATLTYGTDWTVDPNGMTIHLIGQACQTLQSSPNPTVDATFPCGAVIQ
jgi:hypothetical protein